MANTKTPDQWNNHFPIDSLTTNDTVQYTNMQKKHFLYTHVYTSSEHMRLLSSPTRKQKRKQNHGIAPTTPLFAQRTQREVCNAPIPVENKTKLNPRTK